MSPFIAAAQQGGSRETFRLGLFGGAAYNRLDGSIEKLVTITGQPDATAGSWERADGVAPYGGAFAEFALNDWLALHLRASYDSRNVAAASAGRELQAHLDYLSFEPGLRFDLFGERFHLLAGPSGTFGLKRTYDFTPADGETMASVKGATLANARDALLGAWGELGYDIPLTGAASTQSWYLTPFIGASHLFDQMSSTPAGESWNTTTLRGGLRIACGQGSSRPLADAPPDVPQVFVSVVPPHDGIREPREVIEQMPLLGYVFFDGSAAIPGRYVRLSREEAETFDETKLPAAITTGAGHGLDTIDARRSVRQMSLYHNALNILGSRMVHATAGRIKLVGSAPDREQALAMARTVRDYLSGTFGIDSDRIDIEGAITPPHASGTRATPKEDLPLVEEENLRVEVLAEDDALLKPVALSTLEQVAYDNDLVITAKSAIPVEDWVVTITGEGYSRTFGPFYYPKQRIAAAQILGDRDAGRYTAKIVFRTRDHEQVARESRFELRRNRLPSANSDRFSILFEFDESKSVEMYEAFLRNQVAPRIPNGASVFIHGHTDLVGNEGYNIELSARRAEMTERILEEEMRRLGRSAVFDSYGFGEDEIHAPFSNELPEGRYYNRTVMIEIVPGT
jgi:outer membrane protein OmpA-like peptidoglycan-associated protein